MAATEDRTADTARIVRDYFAEIEQGATDAALRHYAPSATGTIQGMVSGDRHVIAEYFAMLHGAFPDFAMTVEDVVAQDDRAAVRWRLRATFAGPGQFNGFEPTGAPLDITGVDIVRVADGRIAELEAWVDGMTVARQLGLLPPAGSKQETRMAKALNLKTRMAQRVNGGGAEQIAEGVWVVRGGVPRNMNVYLVRDGDGVLLFDGGIKAMVNSVGAAAASLGGLTRIVLGHAHEDHRGVAPYLGVPVYCHADDKADAEGDGGRHYFDFSLLDRPARWTMPKMLDHWEPRSGADRPVPRVRPAGAGQRRLLHARPADRPPRPRARAARGVQLRHRAGPGVDPQARGARARRRVGRPRRAADRRRARAARAGGGDDLVGKRGRRRAGGGPEPKLEAPTTDYTSPGGDVLTLRGALSPKTRAEYARAADPSQARAAASQEDVWARALEFLFERLVARWVVNGVPTEGSKQLLARFRVATPDERRWVRDVLREHCAEWFPDVKVP
ncbi:MAG: ester cyclase [Solirubrobacterales bacterium]|nr:ester cyclase [Solirubrobacterales bacterium]